MYEVRERTDQAALGPSEMGVRGWYVDEKLGKYGIQD